MRSLKDWPTWNGSCDIILETGQEMTGLWLDELVSDKVLIKTYN